jgi:hypothetical protein
MHVSFGIGFASSDSDMFTDISIYRAALLGTHGTQAGGGNLEINKYIRSANEDEHFPTVKSQICFY